MPFSHLNLLALHSLFLSPSSICHLQKGFSILLAFREFLWLIFFSFSAANQNLRILWNFRLLRFWEKASIGRSEAWQATHKIFDKTKAARECFLVRISIGVVNVIKRIGWKNEKSRSGLFESKQQFETIFFIEIIFLPWIIVLPFCTGSGSRTFFYFVSFGNLCFVLQDRSWWNLARRWSSRAERFSGGGRPCTPDTAGTGCVKGVPLEPQQRRQYSWS